MIRIATQPKLSVNPLPIDLSILDELFRFIKTVFRLRFLFEAYHLWTLRDIAYNSADEECTLCLFLDHKIAHEGYQNYKIGFKIELLGQYCSHQFIAPYMYNLLHWINGQGDIANSHMRRPSLLFFDLHYSIQRMKIPSLRGTQECQFIVFY